MAKKLTGMDIFKLLPKTNCGECGVPTCMAFAMKLAQKNAELASCPYASDTAKEVIGAAAEPPIRKVTFGETITCGNELVMFRHEKTFVHQTVFAFTLPSDLNGNKIIDQCTQVKEYCLERVGEQLRIEAIVVEDHSGSTDEYVAAVETAASSFSGGIILKSALPERLMAAALAAVSRCPLLHGATAATVAALADFSLENKLPLVITAPSPDALFALAQTCLEKGLRDLVLDIPAADCAAFVPFNTILRKSALGGIKPLGFPIINTLPQGGASFDLVADATACICKYASILVIATLDEEALLPLMMLRQNIYTDPQKPIQVEPGIYTIGEATPASPLFVTTNFSLTYFIVSGELESSGVGCRLAVVETEGMSVLTSWAAGKFSGEKIAAFLKGKEIDGSFTNRRIIIPGYVATISGELEDQMPGWEILVGPQEASDIGPYVKRFA